MGKDLLLEIGTEEIPAGFLTKAREDLKSLAEKLFSDERLAYTAVETFATPRRLILHVEGLAEEQEDLSRKVVGPPRSAAYDADGKATKAAVGFARSQGVEVEALTIEETPKGEYLCAVKEEAGDTTPAVLARRLPGLITSIPFPKSMRWGSGNLRFARPIHWILSLYNEEVVPFELEGLKSGNLSRGHRFMSAGSFTVHSFKAFRTSARERFIMIDPDERVAEIRRQIEKIEQEVEGNVIPDEDLLQEVACLVEFPTALCGGFDPEFLQIPRQILITSMREHQRYFSMENDQGELIPHFVTVSNTRPKDPAAIVAGNERVLRARLTDAAYFFKTDRKRPLAYYVEDLKGVTFQEKLGTLFEKVERVRSLALWLVDKAGLSDRKSVERTALLCKADLCSEMVGEFPSLQGVMGREYALLSGEPDNVAQAIEEHYRPRFVGDPVPESDTGAMVSLADKMDTIAGCFGIGLKPSGSVDPYALRRQTLAILAILLNKGYPVGLSEMVDAALSFLSEKISLDAAACREEILEYFKGRLSGLFISDGHRYDTVEAALEAGFDQVSRTQAKVEALSLFRKDSLFQPFTVVCKRAMNIIKNNEIGKLDKKLLKDESEKLLLDATIQVEEKIPALIASAQYGETLNAIASLREPIDRFFDRVMVMDKDDQVRENRLALLHRVAALVSPIADFSKIVID
jgi:glycyl-tRNA synthetase beta chain